MKIDRMGGAISHVMCTLGSLAIFVMLVVTVADVIMNKVFGAPFPGATEIITTVMPISVFAFLVTTQMKGRHIHIEMLHDLVGAKWQVALKTLSLGVGIYLFGLLTYLNVPLAIYSTRIGEHTGGSIGIPIYPTKIIIPLATGLMTLQLVYELYKLLRGMFRRVEQ